MRRLVPVVCVLLFAGWARAEGRPLSLRDAIALAVRQNPALAAAGAEVAIAEGRMLAARGLDDMVLEVSAVGRGTRLDAAPGVPGQQRAFEGVLGSLSLTQPLATGGNFGLQLESGYGRARTETDADGTPVERWVSGGTSPSVQLSFEQPLLRGFGSDVARAERRRARLQRDLAGAEREGVAAALLREVIGGYWELAYSAEELAIRRASLAAAREQLLRVQANITVGKLPPSATAEIEVAIALRADAALAAEQAETDRSLELGLACGVLATEGLVAADPLPAGFDAAPRTTQEVMDAALARNAQLQAVMQLARGSAVEIEVTENGLLPQLDLTLGGGRLGSASDPASADRQVPGFTGYTVAAGLTLALPLGRHASEGARRAAGERLRRVQLDEVQIGAQVRAGVLRGIARRETARRRAEVLAPSARAAALDLEAEKARFEVGRASNFDVLRRQDQLMLVQLLLLRARVDQLAASVALEALTGEVLERNGVVLREGDR